MSPVSSKSVSWGNIQGEPSLFPPSPHLHAPAEAGADPVGSADQARTDAILAAKAAVDDRVGNDLAPLEYGRVPMQYIGNGPKDTTTFLRGDGSFEVIDLTKAKTSGYFPAGW